MVMVTGDHKDTAAYIAKDCGIYLPEENGVVMEASEFRKHYDEAFLAQHGSRLQRYCRREETQQGDEHVTVLSPYTAEGGGMLDWKQAIGPICEKPRKQVMYGQKDKATEYHSDLQSLVRGSPPQLDMWAYAVRNQEMENIDSWSADVVKQIEALRVEAVEAYLILDGNKRAAAMQGIEEKGTALAKSLAASGAPADAVIATEKMAFFILPPADFRNKSVMKMGAKQRDAIDGGPEAKKLWNVVDDILFAKDANGERIRLGGLQVLARSLPDDKLKLVRRFMKEDEIVGVTGDGTNDAPALRNANVGLAMGSGTQVARDAAHITILDDNFRSIVDAVKWGRNVFDNIRKFLQFQLTVNIVALTLTFIMACMVDGDVTKELPLNAVMLLWVNLIMDSMGALALATETPSDKLLDRPPHGKERLLSVSMCVMNLTQATFQLILLFIFSSEAEFVKDLVAYDDGCPTFAIVSNECCDKNDFGSDECTFRQNTLVFNMFVFCQFWNEINCRKLKEFNVLEGFFDSMMFTYVLIFTFFLQFIMVELGSKGVGTNGLHWVQWLFCIAVGLGSLPCGVISRMIPIKSLEDRFMYGKDVGDDDVEEEEEEAEDIDDGAPSGSTSVPMASVEPTADEPPPTDDAKNA